MKIGIRFGWVSACALLAACANETLDGGSGEADASAGRVAVTAQALTSPPDLGCSPGTFNGHDYWFCPVNRGWQSARTKCQAIGYDLAAVNDAAENSFLLSRTALDVWIGGRDTAAEGVWRWVGTEQQFWQGKANGTPIAGVYRNWQTGQPDDLFNQDCLTFRGGLGLGRWTDDSCSLLRNYVCEGDLCPSDPTKTEPGQCGCGTPDTDTDGDGTPDCDDLCPVDANKTNPGVCGCDFSDADADGDGVVACEDHCPNDPSKILPGDCGCADAPAAEGTACNDGLCSANSACDGEGTCGDPNDCVEPDTLCTYARRAGSHYWFCRNERKFDQSRTRCQNVGMDLASIESAGEDHFIKDEASLFEHLWVGGSDQVTEGDFFWLGTSTQFWTGGQSGNAVGSAYTNWDPFQPNNDSLFTARDCVAKDPGLVHGEWVVFPCSFDMGYVCELFDSCPTDPTKTEPGQCDCGEAETDRDGDDTPDCVDGCPDDPEKVAPGISGCGNDDTDTDGDGVVDVFDECPNDAPDTRRGQCGCPSDPAPPATPCTEGPCEGVSTCDGNGQCIYDPSCLPDDGCIPVDIGSSVYFVCPPGGGGPGDTTTWTDADAACGVDGTRRLVQIDDATENGVLTMLLAMVGSAPAWIGGNDLGVEGTWRWRTSSGTEGDQFWSGGPTGSTVGSLYSNWGPGDPGGGEPQDCAALAATGRWQDEACATNRPYLCESTGGHRNDGVPQPETVSFCDVIPGLCGPNGDPLPQPTDAANCVLEGNAYGGIVCLPGQEALCQQQAFEEIDDCYDCRAPSTWEQCDAACEGIAENPPQGTPCTSIFSPVDVRFCEAHTFQMNGGSRVPCTYHPDPLVADAPCDTANDFLCMHVYDCPNGNEVCDERDPSDPLKCINRCEGQNFCAKPDANCADVAATPGLDCSVVEICQDEDTKYGVVDPYADPDSDLGPEPFTTSEFPAVPPPPASEPYDDDGERTRDKCATPADCDESHSYCHYQVNDVLPTKGDQTDKNGNADGGDFVEFNFEPNLNIGYEAVPGPFGLATPKLTAGASLLAGAEFDIGIAQARVDIVDAAAGLTAHRCRVTAGAHFRVFGQDVTDLPVDEFDTNDTPPFPKEEDCEEVFTEFQTAVDRIKKAFRDAQVLLDQYKQVKANPGQYFTSNFCQQVAGTETPRGFPPSPPNCQESARRTINRFIDYYNDHELPALKNKARELVGEVLGSNPIYIDVVPLFNETESDLIVEAFFALGPIPMNLEVESVVSYGVEVGATLDFKVGQALVAALDGTAGRQDLFTAMIKATPHAGAAIRLFVGVGFSINGFGAKAGVEGELNLGTLQAPAHAEVGIGWEASPDPRTVPADILAVAGSNPVDALPRNQYKFLARYEVGAQVGIADLLRGSLAAKVKIEFFFFSKSWRKVLMTFDGFCPTDQNGNPPPDCMKDLITSDGNAKFGDWGFVRMPMPFLKIPRIPASDEITGGTLPVAPVLTELEEPFFDSQCTCVERADQLPPGEEPVDCYRKADCCDLSPDTICFDDPATTSDPLKYCVGCRNEPDTCRQDSDCCPHLQGSGNLGCYVKPSENPFNNPNPVGHCRDCLDLNEECAAPGPGEQDPCCGTANNCIVVNFVTGRRECRINIVE